MLNVPEKCLKELAEKRDKYLKDISIAIENNWKTKTNEQLWLDIVAQVVVVGNSRPAEKLKKKEYKEEISYENLKRIENTEIIRFTIHKILRSIGTMWAARDRMECRKTESLLHNFNIFRHYQNELKGFFSDVESLNDENERVNFVKKHLMYIKNKGARDLLMELGLIQNSIALDVRIVKSLRRLGVDIPENYDKIFAEIENDIKEKICKPLNLKPIELDRLLYNTYYEED